MSGAEKLRGYHAGLKAFLIEKGYDISPDFDEEMHLVGMGKDEYAQTQNTLALAERISDRNARDRQEIDRDSKNVASNREDVIAEREKVPSRAEIGYPLLMHKLGKQYAGITSCVIYVRMSQDRAG